MDAIFDITRRNLLKAGGGALVVSFVLGGEALAEQGGAAKPLSLTEVDSFLTLGEDGMATIYSGKVDLGTGVKTALAQIAAEELDLPMDRIVILQGDTALTPDQGTTYGSTSIQIGGVQIRQAAAAARAKLVAEAVSELGVAAENLKIDGGVISGGGKSVSYAELMRGKSFSITLDPKTPVPTKNPMDFKLVGKAAPRVDIPGKVFGVFTYMQDFRLPDMLHARVVRPPAIGAELLSVDEDSLAGLPGLVKIVREKNFLAVVSETEWGAIKGARMLKANWSDWAGLPDPAKLWEHVRATKVVADEVTGNVGDSAEALGKAGIKKLAATYDFAIHTHGSIGPSCAVAEIQDGKLTVWTSSQATHMLRKQLAKMMALEPTNVRCVYVEGAGCYGRNGNEDASADAALLAKIMGSPVRVQWSRADEHGWDPKGPPTLIDLRGGLDAEGNVVAWEGDFYMPRQTLKKDFSVPLLAATLGGLPAADEMSPGSVFQNSNIPYRFANIKTLCRRLDSTPFRPSWIRTPGRMQNTYANECFVDELAAAAGADPIEFRLKYLDPADTRGREALLRVATLSNWQTRASPSKTASGPLLVGRGVSYVKYELVRTYIAAVAEVEVDPASGRIGVRRFYVSHDCGQIINPDGLRNQIEGNVVQTVSRTLIEELKFNRSTVTSIDWESYPILRFPQAPEVLIDLIDRPNEKPWGAGEPSAAVIPSAISNAVFDATGVRMRSVPYTPDKVKTALREAGKA